MSWFVTETATATPTPKPVIKVAAPKKQATVNTDTLNMRAGPSTQHQVTGTVKRGDRLEILGKNRAGDWLKVAAPGGTEAWVFAQLVTTDVDLDDVPVTVAPTVPPPVK
jgi:N-acetylmuramoyl-L-alanine amidase